MIIQVYMIEEIPSLGSAVMNFLFTTQDLRAMSIINLHSVGFSLAPSHPGSDQTSHGDPDKQHDNAINYTCYT